MKKEIKRQCEYEDLDTGKRCKNIAKYACNLCGYALCRKHEQENCGECPNCEPPMFYKI